MENASSLARRVSPQPIRKARRKELTGMDGLHSFVSSVPSARDSVQLKTTYKSPTSVHVFSFSTDDHALFPSIPPVDPIIIRTQIDLQGWSIEALSPNTTQVTLVEQSDPKGWTNKSSIPQIMANSEQIVGHETLKTGCWSHLSSTCVYVASTQPSLGLASLRSGLEVRR